jgi:hypothetical protein
MKHVLSFFFPPPPLFLDEEGTVEREVTENTGAALTLI